MKRSDFQFELPEHAIAQYPLSERTASRMMVLGREGTALEDRLFADFPMFLRPGDLLVFNDTRVIPARLHGRKSTGGKVEIMIERFIGGDQCLAQIKASKSPRPGSVISLQGALSIEVMERDGDFFRLRGDGGKPIADILSQCGHIPLPPYIQRPDESGDRERYQTVYARAEGAVAAPTAGLHFDRGILDRITDLGVRTAFVTLHVGAGTFQSPRHEDLDRHRMHHEYIEVSEATCRRIEETRRSGGRVVSVGTTVVRCLESAIGQGGALRPYCGETNLFIRPGYQFRTIDALLTNFHMPESTLLMLVCAFAGYDRVMAAYRHAVESGYRFFSYGDAMLIHDQEAKRDAV